MKALTAPTLLPEITLDTSATDFHPIRSVQGGHHHRSAAMSVATDAIDRRIALSNVLGGGQEGTSMRIGVAGITGRMGSMLADQLRAAGETVSGGTGLRGAGSLPDIAALAAVSDVVIDFTHANATGKHAAAMAAAGKPWVIGTSGLSDADEAALHRAAERIAVVYAANFAPGASLVMALAERMAAALPKETYDAEIVEMHHRQKIDAPSGTAIGMGRAVARGRGQDFNAVIDSGRHGHTGPRVTGSIGFASLRGGQVVGEHTLIFAAGSEHVAITHRAFDRAAFAEGAVLAAKWVVGRPVGLYSMLDVLGVRI